MSATAPRRRTFLVYVLLATALASGVALWAAKPDLLFMPHRFKRVEAGQLYRGGQPSTEQLGRIAGKYGVQTVVSLCDEKPQAGKLSERQAAEQAGLRFFNFPMPGNGTGDFDALDAAADQIADPKNHPVYFHCAAGKNRSNAAQAAWRMRHCGWTIEQALSELDRFDLDRSDDTTLVEHLRKYYEERILPRRAGGAQASARVPG